MKTLQDIFTRHAAAPGRWPRVAVSPQEWIYAGEQLAAQKWDAIAYWAEPGMVHLALREHGSGTTGIVSLDASGGSYPALSGGCLAIRRLERAIADLTGLVAEGAPDTRKWLDHGQWTVGAPLGERGLAATAEAYRFLPVEGSSLHQIAVGPVHAGIIEPGHFRFTCNGETIVRLEERLGYVHKGIESLMSGAPLERAAKLAGRVSGDTTVAYATAFSLAVEAANNTVCPERAARLRAIMLELERIANHVGDIGGICNDAAFSLMLANCAVLRERILRVAEFAFGHRLMMDCVVPGGARGDLSPEGQAKISKLLVRVGKDFRDIVALYEDTASLQDRTVKTGMVRHDLVMQFGAGGVVGRASGRSFDARTVLPYPPYDRLTFETPLLQRGDVDARVRIRMAEVEQSLSLLRQLLDVLPAGPVRTAIGAGGGEGAAMVEGFRGDIFVWLRLNRDGSVARCHLRDPSWFQWPLLEASVYGNIVADFPLCNKSFNCSYSGHDL
jgi:Ni,Fe-hydrogenase III large subunit